MFVVGKTYKNRYGDQVRIICTDSKAYGHPIVGLLADGSREVLQTYAENGGWCATHYHHQRDLMPGVIDEPVFVVGETYRNGRGNRVKITSISNHPTYPVRGTECEADGHKVPRNWTTGGTHSVIHPHTANNLIPGAIAEHTFDTTKPVRTRDGRKARILCTDSNNNDYPIVALVTESNGEEESDEYTAQGHYYSTAGLNIAASPADLINVPTHKTMFLNVYKGSPPYSEEVWGTLADTAEEAVRNCRGIHGEPAPREMLIEAHPVQVPV